MRRLSLIMETKLRRDPWSGACPAVDPVLHPWVEDGAVVSRVGRRLLSVGQGAGGIRASVSDLTKSHHVSRHLTSLAPQPPHERTDRVQSTCSGRFDRIFRNEGVTGSNPVSSTQLSDHAGEVDGSSACAVLLRRRHPCLTVILPLPVPAFGTTTLGGTPSREVSSSLLVGSNGRSRSDRWNSLPA